jgi:hypothetical protein
MTCQDPFYPCKSVASSEPLDVHEFREEKVLYMVVEHFRNQDALPVYRRFRERGRLAPDGLVYVSSWVDEDMKQCFQVMETEDRQLLDQWIANWKDIVDFDVYPVITSAEAAARVEPLL